MRQQLVRPIDLLRCFSIGPQTMIAGQVFGQTAGAEAQNEMIEYLRNQVARSEQG